MYRVILVDDERLIIRGLSTVVPWAEMGCEVAGTAHDGAGGLVLIRDLRPDIVLTAYRDFEYARQAITLGVCRYLLKPSNLEELKDAVREMVSRLDAMPRLKDDHAEDETAKEAGNHLVKAAQSYMKEHCTEQHLSLSDVADHVYVSQWHLSKLLNRETNQSFFDLLGNMRIARAKKLLADPSLRIHEIAEIAGFSDVAHFSRSFKKLTGLTPGEYRDQQG